VSTEAHGKGFAVCPKKAHGKDALCRRLFAVCPLPCAAHGKPFAVGFLGFTV